MQKKNKKKSPEDNKRSIWNLKVPRWWKHVHSTQIDALHVFRNATWTEREHQTNVTAVKVLCFEIFPKDSISLEWCFQLLCWWPLRKLATSEMSWHPSEMTHTLYRESDVETCGKNISLLNFIKWTSTDCWFTLAKYCMSMAFQEMIKGKWYFFVLIEVKIFKTLRHAESKTLKELWGKQWQT